MKRVFSFVIIITMLAGLIFMRNYNIEQFIRNGIQQRPIGVDAFYGENVIINGRVAIYQWSESFNDFDPLEYNVLIEGNENIFRSPRNDDLVYLVKRDGYKSYGLEFHSFDVATERRLENMKQYYSETKQGFDPDSVDYSPYEYKHLLEMIYNVNSADDIVSIKISPSKRDNTPAGMGIQKRIGIIEITDKALINEFYDVITAMSYTFDEMFVQPEDFANEREISLTLASGRTIDKLRYYRTEGRFFEYGQMNYNILSADFQQRMAEIFKITDEIPELPLDSSSPALLLELHAGIENADDIDHILVDKCHHNPLTSVETFTISDRQTISRFYDIVSNMVASEPNDNSKIQYGVTNGKHLRSITFVGKSGQYTLCYSPWTRNFHNDDTLFEKVDHEIRKEIGGYLNIPSHIYGS